MLIASPVKVIQLSPFRRTQRHPSINTRLAFSLLLRRLVPLAAAPVPGTIRSVGLGWVVSVRLIRLVGLGWVGLGLTGG